MQLYENKDPSTFTAFPAPVPRTVPNTDEGLKKLPEMSKWIETKMDDFIELHKHDMNF